MTAIRRGFITGLLLVVAATAAHAQGSVRDFSWLTGTWEGAMTGNSARADITFTAPNAGLITGTMRLVDDHQQVLVIELLTLVDSANGVLLRFRHFSPALEAYEPTFRQNMRLTSHAADQDVFENSVAYDKTLMSTQPRRTAFIRRGADEFVGRSDIIGDDGKPAVVEVTYKRRK